MNFVLIFCLLCIFGHKASGNTDTPARPIQIMVPIKQEFKLKFEELRPILEDETIKDRHVVVVSIAGAFRQGKSFLSNFFLKYLRAQVIFHEKSWRKKNVFQFSQEKDRIDHDKLSSHKIYYIFFQF